MPGSGGHMREVARFSDVYQAEVAASFLAAHGFAAIVAERTAATMNPVLQTALGGVRVLTPDNGADIARDLLARAARGEFADADEEPEADRAAEIATARGGGVFRIVTVIAALILGNGYAGRAYVGARAGLGALQVAGLLLLGGFVVGWGVVVVMGMLGQG